MFDGIKRMFRQANLTSAELEALDRGEAAVVKFDEEITREKVELLVTGRAHISRNPPKGIKRPRKSKSNGEGE